MAVQALAYGKLPATEAYQQLLQMPLAAGALPPEMAQYPLTAAPDVQPRLEHHSQVGDLSTEPWIIANKPYSALSRHHDILGATFVHQLIYISLVTPMSKVILSCNTTMLSVKTIFNPPSADNSIVNCSREPEMVVPPQQQPAATQRLPPWGPPPGGAPLGRHLAQGQGHRSGT